jgi:hypothetical protein
VTEDELRKLKPGDLIQNLGSGNIYIVIDVRDRIIAIRTIDITNLDEWDVVI